MQNAEDFGHAGLSACERKVRILSGRIDVGRLIGISHKIWDYLREAMTFWRVMKTKVMIG